MARDARLKVEAALRRHDPVVGMPLRTCNLRMCDKFVSGPAKRRMKIEFPPSRTML
jgi:hypothetical protein